MNRRAFLQWTAGALCEHSGRYRPNLQTQHLIFIVPSGARKKDYYENAWLAPNIRRIARGGYVFEEDHCEQVSSHDDAFAELVFGIRGYRQVGSLRAIPQVMEHHQPRILICRELSHDVGHDGFSQYLSAVKRTDAEIGVMFDWVKSHPYFANNTAIVIRPDFGRDDEINASGELHHSTGFYCAHRVASIFWGPDFSRGTDSKTVVNSLDMAPTLMSLFD